MMTEAERRQIVEDLIRLGYRHPTAEAWPAEPDPPLVRFSKDFLIALATLVAAYWLGEPLHGTYDTRALMPIILGATCVGLATRLGYTKNATWLYAVMAFVPFVFVHNSDTCPWRICGMLAIFVIAMMAGCRNRLGSSLPLGLPWQRFRR